MSNFWEVLNLQPTTDIEVIKSSRRSLMKNWHPDVAVGAEQQAICNARCAEINAAYDSAIAFANAWKPVAAGAETDRGQRMARMVSSPTITSTLFFVLSRPIGSKSSWSTTVPKSA
jgi:hypothetical protein